MKAVVLLVALIAVTANALPLAKMKVKKSSPCNLKAANGCQTCVSTTNADQVKFSPTVGVDYQWEACYWLATNEGEKKCRTKKDGEALPVGAIYRDANLCPEAVVPPSNAALTGEDKGHKGRTRPVGPGMSISLRYDQGPGSIAAILKGKSNALYILTAAHVVHRKKSWNGNGNPDVPGKAVDLSDEFVIQPAAMYGGKQAADIVGKVVHAKHGDFRAADGKDYGLDIALVKLCTGAGAPYAECPAAVAADNRLPDVSTPSYARLTIAGTDTVAKDDNVYKWGAFAGKGTGKVVQTDYSVNALQLKDVGPHDFHNLILACGINQEPGDSGCPLVKANNKLVGVASGKRNRPGKNSCGPDDGYADCCVITSPIGPTLEYLNANVAGDAPYVVA